MQREIVLTGGYDPCIGIEGYDHTFPMPCMLAKEDESEPSRWFRTRMEKNDVEMQVRWWLESIHERLTDLWIFGNPFEPNDVLHLASQEWEGIQLPERWWQVEDDFIEPRPFIPRPDDI